MDELTKGYIYQYTCWAIILIFLIGILFKIIYKIKYSKGIPASGMKCPNCGSVHTVSVNIERADKIVNGEKVYSGRFDIYSDGIYKKEDAEMGYCSHCKYKWKICSVKS